LEFASIKGLAYGHETEMEMYKTKIDLSYYTNGLFCGAWSALAYDSARLGTREKISALENAQASDS